MDVRIPGSFGCTMGEVNCIGIGCMLLEVRYANVGLLVVQGRSEIDK